MKSTIFSLFISSMLLLCGSVTAVFAGGGQYTPINFSYGQKVVGKTIDLEIEVYEYSSAQPQKVVGEEFSFIASGYLPNSNCVTTQPVSDGNGRIKATCSADEYGHFTFLIEPVTKDKVKSNSSNISLYFVKEKDDKNREFPDLSTKDDSYELVIDPASVDAKIGQDFIVKAKIMHDGKEVENYNDIDRFSWMVLKGSIVGLGSPDKENCTGRYCKNRVLRYKLVNPGTTIMRVTAYLNNGKKVVSKNIKLSTDSSESISDSLPTTTPEESSSEDDQETTSQNTEEQSNQPEILQSESDTLEEQDMKIQELNEKIAALESDVVEQKKEINALQRLIISISNQLKKLFGLDIN